LHFLTSYNTPNVFKADFPCKIVSPYPCLLSSMVLSFYKILICVKPLLVRAIANDSPLMPAPIIAMRDYLVIVFIVIFEAKANNSKSKYVPY